MLQRKLKVLFLITTFLVILVFFVAVISLMNVTPFEKNNSYTAPVQRVPYIVKEGLDIWELKQGLQPFCKKVRSIKPKNNPIIENNPIIVIDPSPNNSITCNVDGKNYTLNRLLELKPNDSFVEKRYYVLLKEDYVTKKTAFDTFDFNNRAQTTQSVTLYTEVDPTTNNCSLENSFKINSNAIVTTKSSESPEIIYCNILKGGVLYQFEMFKVDYTYRKSGQETTVTGYVAQEDLKTPDDTSRKIIRIQ